LEIVATITAYQDNDYARVFDKEFFYFNKQSIMLTNIDQLGQSYEAHLPVREDKFGEMKRASSIELTPTKISQGDLELTEFSITKYPATHASLDNYCADAIKPQVSQFDYKEQPLVITTADAKYHYDAEQETLIKETNGKKEALGCGKIIITASYKKANKKLPERIEISVELTADYQKDYEIIPFYKNEAANQDAISAFMARYISKPFVYLENVVGVEINFNKIFYAPEKLRAVSEIMDDIAVLNVKLATLEAELVL
jgi:type I restriction enzyme M protein